MVLAARNVELAREPERLRTGFLEQVHKVRDEACGERDEAIRDRRKWQEEVFDGSH